MVHTRDLRHEPWRYRLRAFVSKPANLLLVFFLIVLVLLSLLPMATMLSNMFTVHVGTEKKLLRLPVGSTTLWHFQKLFAGDDWSQVNFWQPLCNSLIVALGSGILGIAVGGTVAWFITRSDLKCKKFISAVFVFPYMMPAWTLALFWTNMFQNSHVGGGNIGMVESIFGVCMPEWFVYGLFPMIIVTGLHYSPFAYLLIGGILKNMDATLEESATILKASRATIIRRVTIPIVMPAILSTFLLIFSSGGQVLHALHQDARADSGGLSGAGLHHRVCLHPAGLPDSGRQPALHRQAQILHHRHRQERPGFAGQAAQGQLAHQYSADRLHGVLRHHAADLLRAGIRHPSARQLQPEQHDAPFLDRHGGFGL